MKVAIVYDWLDKWGGVERLLLVLHEMFPEATFYTSYFDVEGAPWAKKLRIKTSFIQKLPDFIKKNRILSVLLYPLAFESFDFSGFDLVISVSSSFAKSIITKPGTLHVSFLLTPTRFLWVTSESYFGNNKLMFVVDQIIRMLKEWDLVAAQRPDYMISISKTVAERCKKYYGRDSEVVYPPFDTEYWNKIKSLPAGRQAKFKITKPYYLVVSRLEPYKKVDLVIVSFKGLNDKKLIVVGTGTQENKLKRISSQNITFIKNVTDKELAYLYQNAKALIMPQLEDFGYVAVEAQFFGCPVIAYRSGGATETVEEDKTGIFFRHQTDSALVDTLAQYDKISYNMKANARKAGLAAVQRFDKKIFVKKSFEYIYSKLDSKT